MVPIIHSQRLNERLTAVGVRSQLVVVKNAGHVFVPVAGPISPTNEEIGRLIADFFDREIRKA